MKAVNNKAAGIAILFEDSVLLGKRADFCYITGQKIPYGGYWSIFGGMIEEGEEPSEAAVREVFEETQIPIDAKDIEFLEKINNKNCEFYFHYYKCNEMLFPVLNKEHTESGWFKIDHLKSLSDPIDDKILDCILKI